MKLIFLILTLLMSMPLLTLMERKILSYSQNRKGPKKAGIGGILQPISDGFKLILKNFPILYFSKKLIFFFLPFLSFFLMVVCWKFFPFFYKPFSKKFSVLMMLCLSSLSVYMILFSGWASNSKYSLMGSIRGAAQKISYEMSLIFMMLFPCCFKFSLNLNLFLSKGFKVGILVFPLFLIWMMKCMAELKRAPFDFAEGESELVSGFNTEYSSLQFAFFFLGEYGMMLFLSFLSVILFFPGGVFMNTLLGLNISFFVILVRASFPRLRYDLLKILAWKFFLPLGMLFLTLALLIN